MVETKTAQHVRDIELHFTEKKKDTSKKIKMISIKIKGCRVVKSTTGPQCKLTREQAWNGNND